MKIKYCRACEGYKETLRFYRDGDKKKKKYTIDQIERAFKLGDERMKKSNGHRYIQILKTRCAYCGRSPKQKGRCSRWYQTLYTYAIEVLLNNEV